MHPALRWRGPTLPSPARKRPSPPGATSPPATARGCCAGSPRSSTPTSRSSRSSRSRNAGHTIGNARWEAGNVRDVLHFYAAAPERLFGRQIPVAGGLDVTFNEPLGVVGVIVPVELPDADRRLGVRPGAGGGQHGGAQARRADAADRDAARRAGARGRPARGRVPGAARQGLGGRRAVRRPTRTCARSCSPAPPRWAPRSWPSAPPRSSGSRWSSAARAPTSCSPTPTSRRRRPRRPTASSTTPARTAARARGSWCSASVYDRFMELLEPAVKGVRVGTRRLDTAEMGPLISAGAPATSVAAYVPDDAPVAFRGSARQGPGYWFPPTVLTPAAPATAALTAGDLRPGRRGAAVRGRGRRDRAGQRHRLRAVRLDLDRRPRPRAAGVARGRGRQPVGQLALVGALLDAVRRATSSPASAASSARTRSTAFTETKNVFIAHGGARWPMQAAGRTGSPSSPAAASGIGLATGRRLRAGGRDRRGRSTSTPRRRQRWPTSSERPGRASVDVTSPEDNDAHVRRGVRRLRLGRHRLQQRRDLPA